MCLDLDVMVGNLFCVQYTLGLCPVIVLCRCLEAHFYFRNNLIEHLHHLGRFIVCIAIQGCCTHQPRHHPHRL